MIRLCNVTGGEIVSQLNSSSNGVRWDSSSHLEQAASFMYRTGRSGGYCAAAALYSKVCVRSGSMGSCEPVDFKSLY